MVVVRVGSIGTEAVAVELQGIGARALNLEPYWPNAIDMLTNLAQRQYDTDGAAHGKKWYPLVPSTVRRKAAKGRDNGILRETMETMLSLTRPYAPNQKIESGPDSLVFGSELPQFAYHEDPGPEAWYPPRRVFQFTDQDANEHAYGMMEYIVGTAGSTRRIFRSRGRFAKAPSGWVDPS